MKLREVMDIAVKAGEILLTSGAEISRVEDTIKRICNNYKVDCDSFVLPTGIFVSGSMNGYETVSLVKRVKNNAVNLKKIEMVNSFSRELDLKTVSYDEAMKRLDFIQKDPRFNFGLRLASAGLIAFVYTLLFQGVFLDGISALIIGMVVYILKHKVSEISTLKVFEHFVCGFAAAGLSLLAEKAFPTVNYYKIIIGTIMITVPGVAITNGIKDALYGEITAGISRLAEAAFIVAAVVAGAAIALLIGMRWV